MKRLLITFAIWLLTLLPLVALYGWAVATLWGWFVVPVFGLAALTWQQAIGFAFIVGHLTKSIPNTNWFEEVDNEKTTRDIINGMITTVTRPLVMVGWGWVIMAVFG